MADGKLTMGVEEEFFLLGPTGLLVHEASRTLAEAEGGDLTPELMRCQVESATGICETVDDVRTELTSLRKTLADSAHLRAARLCATGTAPHRQPADPRVGPGSRYRRIADHVGQLVFGGVACGCHVHVGMPDRETAIRVGNHLRPWLPVLLALSGNSPFHQGEDTGYASTRYVVWGAWPTAGPPPYLESEDHYETIVQGLLDSGVALDRKMVYWDARPSEHQPTIEIRIHDVAATVDEAALLAVLVRGLVARCLDLVERKEPAERIPQEVLRGTLWRAARDGLDGPCTDPDTGDLRPVHDILADLLTDLDTDDTAFARDVLARLRTDGGGAHRQRTAFQRAGNLDDVVDLIAEQTAGSR